MIYCIGDSHIINLQRARPDLFTTIALDTPGTICYRSITAFSIGRETTCGYVCESTAQTPKGSTIIMSFGEIDCRHYVPKTSVEKGWSIQEEVDDIVGPYFDQLKRLALDYKVAAMSPYCCPEDHAHPQGNQFADIWQAKTYFSSRLLDFCRGSNIIYIDTHEEVAKHNWDLHSYGTGRPFGDSSHLGPECLLPVVVRAMGL